MSRLFIAALIFQSRFPFHAMAHPCLLSSIVVFSCCCQQQNFLTFDDDDDDDKQEEAMFENFHEWSEKIGGNHVTLN